MGKKIYRPKGPIFGPKQRFFILRDMPTGKFSILTREGVRKIIELTRGGGKKIYWLHYEWGVLSMPCNIKNISIKEKSFYYGKNCMFFSENSIENILY